MITLEDLRARYAEHLAARQRLQKDYQSKDTGYAYVLGELEHLIALVQQRAAEAGTADEVA